MARFSDALAFILLAAVWLGDLGVVEVSSDGPSGTTGSPPAAAPAACCSADSWPALKVDNYSPKGVLDRYKVQGQEPEGCDFDFYRVDPPADSPEKDKGRWIIWNYEIFGLESGRTRMMADLVAGKGFTVIIPDVFRGNGCDPEQGCNLGDFLQKNFGLGHLRDDLEKCILPYAKSLGATSIGAIGFCSGSLPVILQSEHQEIKAGVSMHPSHPNIAMTLGIDERAILGAVKAPQLFMPAGGDGASVKEGGLGSQVLGQKLTILEFPEMKHGWSVRGDLKDPKVERDVRLAFDKAVDFFNGNL